MKRETFLFTRTMRDLRKTGFDIARESRDKIRTTSKLMQGGREVQPKINERQVAVELEQEKRRFVRQRQALERGRKKVEAYRSKLAGILEKNRRLMELRYGLQKQYWAREEEPAALTAKKSSRKAVKEVKLGY